MGAIICFVAGYIMGTRAGEKGFEEIVDAWKTISTSEEVRALISGGRSTAMDMLERGRSMLVERLEPETARHLTRVA